MYVHRRRYHAIIDGIHKAVRARTDGSGFSKENPITRERRVRSSFPFSQEEGPSPRLRPTANPIASFHTLDPFISFSLSLLLLKVSRSVERQYPLMKCLIGRTRQPHHYHSQYYQRFFSVCPQLPFYLPFFSIIFLSINVQRFIYILGENF